MKKRRLSAYWIFVLVFFIVIIIGELLFQIPVVCDFYTDHIFSFGLNTYGRLTGIFPFSVGEILVAAAIFFVFLEIVLLLPLAFLAVLKVCGKRVCSGGGAYRKFVRRYSKCFLVFVLLAAWLMVMNCSSLYGCSKLNVKGNRDKEYGPQQMRILRDYIVKQCNTLSAGMRRDGDGNVDTEGDMAGEVRLAMGKLSRDYPRLAGFYPRPKEMSGSFFMYQAGCDGVYFPFSLEANYCSYISDIRYPHVACHELAHLKGYIYEDEADFIAFLACTGSGDEQLRYAGYLGVLSYVESDYWQGVSDESDVSELEILDVVWKDAPSYTAQTEKMLEEQKEIIDTATVESVGDKITETYMNYYDAKPNYAEVTKLLLAYYDGVLY